MSQRDQDSFCVVSGAGGDGLNLVAADALEQAYCMRHVNVCTELLPVALRCHLQR